MDKPQAGDSSAVKPGTGPKLSRRILLQGAGVIAAGAATAGSAVAASGDPVDIVTSHPGYDPKFPQPGEKTAADYPVSEQTRRLAAYVASAADMPLPEEVIEQSKWHILDTFAAIVAGSQMPAGEPSRNFVRMIAASPACTVIGDSVRSDPITAAMINGTLGHAHEVDDTGGSSGPWHPGINVVPAALAMAEQGTISGMHFIRAIALGVDVGGRVGQAAGLLRNFRTPTVSVCGIFGAAATAASIAGLNEEQVRWALSYTAQQSSGIDSFRRDPDHIEKGFLNGGLGAKGGVTSAMLVKAGFTGVSDIFSGPANFFALFRAAGQEIHEELLTAELGQRFDMLATGFKRRPVAGAISAVLDSLEALLDKQPIDPRQIREIVIRYEPGSVTDNAGPPDMNVQHAVALTLVDKRLTLRSVHDRDRFRDPLLTRLRSITRISPMVIYVQTGKFIDPSVPGNAAKLGLREPVVKITMMDGTVLSQADVAARGESSAHPYTREWVMEKAASLMTPVLGGLATRQLIEQVVNLETMHDIRPLGRLMQVRKAPPSAPMSIWPADTKM